MDPASKLKGKWVAVLGDVMLDRYILGESNRLSPEAPVPVVSVRQEIFCPGGAANVAANIASLGGRAFLFGVLGRDEAGKFLIHELKKKKINVSGLLFENERITTQKTRILIGGRHIARLDKEVTREISATIEKKILKVLAGVIKNCDAVVFSDYAKGFFRGKLSQNIIRLAKRRRLPIIADIKPMNMVYFKGATLVVPNKKEAMVMAGINDVKIAGRRLQKKLSCNVLITEGAQGMTLFERDKTVHIPAKDKEVLDITGAGDTVAASLALALGADFSLKESAEIANEAAGIVVGKIGTATVSLKELQKELYRG